MKPYHKSYWKTVVLAGGFGCALAGLAIGWLLFGGDVAAQVGLSSPAHFSWAVVIVLLAPAAFCFAVSVGGLLSLYKDITQDGRP
jgi:hypothetical protein